ncbi:MAG: family 43 glycosylhydrolase [Lachnospiraceae bacterium]|nr:family 43 glycosylhydrolase [Lachnospiraceae bacterium]
MDKQKKIFFSVYNREANPEEYPGGLAYSVHMAYSTDGFKFQPLNKNYGIVFEKGDISNQDTIIPKGVRNPKIFYMDQGTYGICGQRTYEDGSLEDSAINKVVLWTTKDFIHFERMGLIESRLIKQWKHAEFVEVEEEIAQKAITHWRPVRNTDFKLPDTIEVKNEEELDAITAKAVYSDGSEVEKKLYWDKSTIDFQRSGTYEACARVGQKSFVFPLAKGYGDPVLLRWEDKWYFVATNDNLDDIGIYVRQGDCIEDLFKDDVVENLILPLDKKRGFVQTFWAPEFHVIGGELYILFAVSGEMWGPQCHIMKLKKGASIICEESWENPIPVVRKDGSPLAPNAISLDMTYIGAASGSYMVWSYRKNIGTPLDTGSMLYIATIDEKEPWKLTSEPVLLTRPLYGWENVDGTINNEGPYCFVKNHTVYLTYSGGAANGYTYALGLLTADERENLLDINSWTKRITPVLTYYSVPGEYGPGHNSFFINEDGELMIAYHGETDIKEHLRCDGIRRVHFRKDGQPDFELSNEQELKEEYRMIQRKIVVK